MPMDENVFIIFRRNMYKLCRWHRDNQYRLKEWNATMK